ncbi:MAG: hypothetical protein ACAI35_19765 [Candidatus Methylacidiphilales bacterium]
MTISLAIARWIRRYPVLSFMGAVVAVLLVMAVVTYFSVRNALEGTSISNEQISSLCWSPDGRELAVSDTWGTRVLACNDSRLEFSRILEGNALVDMRWSRDGTMLACYDISAFVMLEADSGKSTTVHFFDSFPIEGLDWGPLNQLAFAGDDKLRSARIENKGTAPVTFDTIPADILEPLRSGSGRYGEVEAEVRWTDRGLTMLHIFPKALYIFRAGRRFDPLRIPRPGATRISPTGDEMATLDLSTVPAGIQLWDIASSPQRSRVLSPMSTLILPDETSTLLRPWIQGRLANTIAWSASGRHLAASIVLLRPDGRPSVCLLSWWEAATGRLIASRRLDLSSYSLRIPVSGGYYVTEFSLVAWSTDLSKAAVAVSVWRYNYKGNAIQHIQSIVKVIPAPEEVVKAVGQVRN